MKEISLKDREWIARIKYHDGQETQLHISMMDAIDILSAIALVYRHIIHDQYAEIISIRQSEVGE
jgi:hypothetical protein